MDQPVAITIDMLRAAIRPNQRVVEDGGIKIVVLQRGWVVVGRFSQRGTRCKITNGAVIRRWGTTRGLGEIAVGGPTNNTALEPTPTIEYHELTEVLSLVCEESQWLHHLR